MRILVSTLVIAASAFLACTTDPAPSSTDTDVRTTTAAVDLSRANDTIERAVQIPEYFPVGEDVELRKIGAAGIDDKNALAKVSELDGRLDQQIKDLEARGHKAR